MVRVFARGTSSAAPSGKRRSSSSASKKIVSYSSGKARRSGEATKTGAVCFVLSPQDCSSLTQFYSLLLKIDRRLTKEAKNSLGNDSKQYAQLHQSKIKGSLISGPLLFTRVFVGGMG